MRKFVQTLESKISLHLPRYSCFKMKFEVMFMRCATHVVLVYF